MSYQRVLDAMQEHSLSWKDIDRIEVDEDTYDEFLQRTSLKPSNYETSDHPAVRVTTQQEKLVYVAGNGMEVSVEL